MTVPHLLAFGGNNSGGNVTSSTPDLAALVGSPTIGDLIVILMVKDGTGAFTWPTGWTTGILNGSLQEWSDFADTANTIRTAGHYRVWQSGDDETPTITHASEATAWHVYRFRVGSFKTAVADNIRFVHSTNSSTNPDPPSLSSDNGNVPRFWIAGAMEDGNVAMTAGSSGYTGFRNDRVAIAGGSSIGSAYKWTNGPSITEDPGALTAATEDWLGFTVYLNGEPNYETPPGPLMGRVAVPRSAFR